MEDLGWSSFGTGKPGGGVGRGDGIPQIRNVEGIEKVLVLAAGMPWGGTWTVRNGVRKGRESGPWGD